ncbi:helix-turn-helix domain-containing protein [Streptomyces luteogriseus]|uniref:helix-turn-helix domain-containing protein n=1 Tax=Streptomyces luteogriseus TaxID=68233 RepID=UPI00379A6EE5
MNIYARPDRQPMTAEELAQVVGTTKAQILAYENGHRVPDPQRIRALARALRVHPMVLMNRHRQEDWEVADIRRACGLRAEDVVSRLGISPKVYRRFETEGIVPSRRPQFLDEVSKTFAIPRRFLEQALDATPAVKKRRRRVKELVTKLADTYVPAPGPWQGPAPDDPDLVELATIYGRPLTRTRRVMTYELGELRQRYVRAMREHVIAQFDTDRERQTSAQYAVVRWNDIFTRDLARIPSRLEAFHRNAQPSDVWELLTDLHNVDAAARGEGLWAVAKFLTEDATVLPPHLVEQRSIDGVLACRLSRAGFAHVSRFAGLYAALYPVTRKPARTGRMTAARKGVLPPGTFTLSNHSERLVIPQPYLEKVVSDDSLSARARVVELSQRHFLTINANSMAVAAFTLPSGNVPLHDQVTLIEWEEGEEAGPGGPNPERAGEPPNT